MRPRDHCVLGLLLVFAMLYGLASNTEAAPKQKVVFWPGYGVTEQSTQWEAWLKTEFEHRYPNAELVIERPQGTFDVMAAGGVVPDLWSPEDRIIRYARLGMLEPIDKYLASRSDLRPEAFLPGAGEYMQYKGQTYGLPFAVGLYSLMYDPGPMVEAGLDPGPLAMKSWNDFRNYARKLTIVDGDKITRGGHIINMWGPWPFAAWLGTNDARMIEGNRAAFHQPRGEETLEMLVNLQLNDRATTSAGGPINGIAAGDGVMTECHLGCVTYIRAQNPTADIRLTSLPVGPSGSSRSVAAYYNAYAIPKGAKNPDLAFELMALMVDSKGTRESFGIWPVVPARLDLFRTGLWQDYARANPEASTFVDMVQYFVPAPASIREWMQQFMGLYTTAFSGQTPVREVLMNGAQTVDRILREIE